MLRECFQVQHLRTFARGEVVPGPPARMIPVRVRDDRAVYAEPRVNKKVAGGAIESAVCRLEEHLWLAPWY